MKAPLISIITPTFNCGGKIAATAASVFCQEEGLFEYLVIDGGSIDDTLSHLPPIQPNFRWVSEPDQGLYDAMNKGIGLSRGKFLYFLGAGDRLRPGVLREFAERLPPDANGRDFVYGDMVLPLEGGRYGGVFTPTRFARENIGHQAIFYGHDIFALLGGFNTRYKVYADFEMNIRCFGQPKIRKIYVDLAIADFEGGGVSDVEDPQFVREWTLIVTRHLGLRPGLRTIYYRLFYRNYRRLRNWLAFHLLHRRELPGRMLQSLGLRPKSGKSSQAE